MMKFYWKIILILGIVLVRLNATAQRNIVEVPTTDIVEYSKLFVQEQVAISVEGFNASTVTTYGLGRNLEVGLSVNQLFFQRGSGVEVDPSKPEDNPDLLLNAQKAFIVQDWLKIGIGTRSGASAAKSFHETKFVSFDYVNSRWSIANDKINLNAGGYYVNDAFKGEGTNWGAMAGLDIELVSDKLNLIGDILSGNSSLSVFNTGLEISLPKNWKIAFAEQFPVPGSDNERGGVIQISHN